DGAAWMLLPSVEQADVLFGTVLEVGVLDDHRVAGGLRERRANGGTFPTVALVGEHPHRWDGRSDAGFQTVAGAIVDDDDLLLHRHGIYALEQLDAGRVLV